MAIQNFIPTVFAANLTESLKKIHVFASVANQEYSGQINELGGKVKLIQVSDVTINSHTRNTAITLQDLDDAVTELIADQAYDFGFSTEDAEAVMMKGAILGSAQNNAAYGFRDTADSYMAGLYAQSGLTSYSTGTTPWDVTSLNVEDVLLDIKEKMARVPRDGRFLICPEWFHNKLILAGLASKSETNELFANGMVGRVQGFDILISENVSANNTTTWDQTRIIAGVRGQSFGYVDAILKIRAYQPDGKFQDAVIGLYVFGAKMIRPDMTCTAYCDKTAES